MNTDIVYKFIGERGSFVVGAPARDIQEWEVMAEPEIGAIVESNMKTSGAIYAKVAKSGKGKGRGESLPVLADDSTNGTTERPAEEIGVAPSA